MTGTWITVAACVLVFVAFMALDRWHDRRCRRRAQAEALRDAAPIFLQLSRDPLNPRDRQR